MKDYKIRVLELFNSENKSIEGTRKAASPAAQETLNLDQIIVVSTSMNPPGVFKQDMDPHSWMLYNIGFVSKNCKGMVVRFEYIHSI